MESDTKRTEPSHMATFTPPVWRLLAGGIELASALSLAQLGPLGGRIVKNVVKAFNESPQRRPLPQPVLPQVFCKELANHRAFGTADGQAKCRCECAANWSNRIQGCAFIDWVLTGNTIGTTDHQFRQHYGVRRTVFDFGKVSNAALAVGERTAPFPVTRVQVNVATRLQT